MEENEISKIFKVGKIQLIWAVVLVVIGIALLGIAFYIDSGDRETATDLHQLIYNYEDKENEYASINLAYVPFGFAIEGENLKYYFAMDSNEYLYIVRITDKTYEKIVKQKEEQGDNFFYELKGYVFEIPSELKKLGIEAYNEAFEKEIFTKSNFEEFVGNVYLDETYTPQSENATVLITISCFAFVAAIIVFCVFVSQKIKTAKVDKTRIEEAKEELRSTSVKVYSKQKMYLTNKYVISNYGGLQIYEYSEILWLYNLINYYRGIATGKSLMAGLANKKKIAIGYSTDVNNQTLEEIMEKILEKNKNVRIGFTDENKKYFKDYKKGNLL